MVQPPAARLVTVSAIPSTFDPVGKMLTDGQSAAIAFCTDSTGNDPTTEYIALMCDRIHALWPSHRIEFYGYDNTTPNNFTPALRVKKYDGATVTERRIAFTGTANSGLTWGSAAPNQITGDLDVRAKVAATTWTTGAERVICGKFAGSGARSWYFWVDATVVGFSWTTDGSTVQSVSVAQTNFTLVNGTPTYLRVVLDVDNGAAGRDVKFYQSTDEGVTWVQKGSTSTAAGVTSLFSDTVTPLEVAGRNSSGSNTWVGDIYRVEIRSGIDGAIVAPTLPDLWNPNTTAYNGVASGDPVLTVWAAAASGWGIGNFVTNAARMIPAAGQTLQVVATSHNDVYLRDAALWNQWDTLMAAVRTRAPGAAICVQNQNPQISPRSAYSQLWHQVRCRMLESYAMSRGYEFVDVFSAFNASPLGLAALTSVVDGEHPSVPAGMQLWATTLQTKWKIQP